MEYTYHNYIFKQRAKIIFDPVDLTKKHVKQSEWKKSAIAFIDDPDFCSYYSWFIKKRYNLELQKPLRGIHFTVINDKISDLKKYEIGKKIFNNTFVNLKYSIDPRTDGKNWWVGVKSEDAEKIRTAVGLEPKPFWGYHLTIGRADGDLREQHSRYIHDLIKKYKNEYL